MRRPRRAPAFSWGARPPPSPATALAGFHDNWQPGAGGISEPAGSEASCSLFLLVPFFFFLYVVLEPGLVLPQPGVFTPGLRNKNRV